MSLSTHWHWALRQLARQLWLTALLYALAAVGSVFLAALLAPLIPPGTAEYVTAEAADRVLGILASSMLAVTTFSLATMVTAHGAVTGNTSPRATTLVLDNEITRHALGVFIGSFLFSLVGLVALNAGVYGERGHVVLFALTALVIVLIVVALLRWIDHLSHLVRVSETTERVENATLDALLERARYPGLGARPCGQLAEQIPETARRVSAGQVGYVRHIDIPALIEVAQNSDVELFVCAVPGTFVDSGTALLAVSGGGSADEDALREAFAIGATRTFDFDPRFGLIVLAEIASRALSPGINDPGTAIDIIGRATRLLTRWVQTRAEVADGDERGKDDGQDECCEARVWLPALDPFDLLDDIVTPLSRDGAAMLSVQVRLQKALASLAALPDAELQAAARLHSRRAWERAQTALVMDFEREALAALVLPE
ncbi:DUF2254 domain-containing protein [Parahaliea aestuarii]|uniref:DUF2254 domain-containing protein n=1 Tax=Parahaliea aestuarii TaxID=1852021 RepID=A0A5C8ZQE8_9GAMM|nr:DUF2254 domain-containing protein [Parahaliea aestuarii]TXS89959.1 DUF2254 domain-containing protein [Parahaliea aestuarii]